MQIEKTIVLTLQKLLHKRENTVKQEREQFIIKTKELSLELADITLSELHVIDCIGTYGTKNVTSLSKEMAMTRGAISKICSKLLKRKVIDKVHLADNQKEVHFRLTEFGEKIFSLHETLHQAAEEKVIRFLKKYTPAELQFIDRLLKDIINEL